MRTAKINTDIFLKDFFDEAEKLIKELNHNVLELENELKNDNVPPARINRIFAAIHTLKGIAGTVGFHKITEFTHKLEHLLDQLRLGKITCSLPLIDLLFKSLDFISISIEQASKGQATELDVIPLTQLIDEYISQQGKIKVTAQLPSDLDDAIKEVLTEYEQTRLLHNLQSAKKLFELTLDLKFNNFESELTELLDKLSTCGEVIARAPSSLSNSEFDLRFKILFATEVTREELEQTISKENVIIQQIAADYLTPTPSTPQQYVIPSEQRTGDDTVRVDMKKLQYLMNLVNELMLTRSKTLLLASELAELEGYSRLATNMNQLHFMLEEQIDELRDTILQLRMVPIGRLFNGFKRLVRDFAKEKGKEIELIIYGEDTELDKLIIDELSEPMVHLIRNAIDHGIELPHVRKQLNKPSAGSIWLRAFQQGNCIVIEIEDDGCGIDLQQLHTKAIQLKLLPPESTPTEEELLNLIFLPDFSTSDIVTEVSGRGIGLEIVKNSVTSLRGYIKVYTEKGKGTKFAITIPITLAIIPVLLIGLKEHTYALPVSFVQESVKITSDKIKRTNNREFCQIRDNIIPLIRLNRFLLDEYVNDDRNNHFVVVVSIAEKTIGLLVDELKGEKDIVIKPLNEWLSNTTNIAGATDIGDGRVTLVLDIDAIVEKAFSS